MGRKQFLRLGLFQLAAGGLSVLFLGVLNRVMRVELGLDLITVTILVGGGHYLGALVAIPFGYFSDRHPLLGYRRSIYILLGSLSAVCILVSSPWVVRWIAASPTWLRVGSGFLFFLTEGTSTYIAGTAYLSLITDLTDSEQRGQITGFIWTLLMVGIILTGVLSGFLLEPFSMVRVMILFTAAAAIVMLFTLIALWGQEKPAVEPHPRKTGNLGLAFQGVLENRSARWFGAFLFLSMFSFFMQDVLLEPFGGEVFGLPAAATTRFNAYLGFGLVGAMLFGGMRLIPIKGKHWTTSLGILLMVGAFSALGLSSVFGYSPALPLILVFYCRGGFFDDGYDLFPPDRSLCRCLDADSGGCKRSHGDRRGRAANSADLLGIFSGGSLCRGVFSRSAGAAGITGFPAAGSSGRLSGAGSCLHPGGSREFAISGL
mgnify:CR=1 FL=1